MPSPNNGQFSLERRARLALVAALVCLGTPARADEPTDVRATAEALYQEAYRLSQEGKFAEACKKLEESDRLDPATGTKVELAKCYENTNRPASAWALYIAAADADHLAGKNKTREAMARERAAALEPDLPRLVLVVSAEAASAPGLIVERDGVAIRKPLWGTPLTVDPGEHTIRVTAPGKLAWEGKASAIARQETKIDVPALKDDPRAVEQKEIVPPPPTGLGPRKIGAIVAGGVAVASLAAGGVFGGLAFSKWADVETGAGENCSNPGSFSGCNADFQKKGEQARTFADVSTATFIVGGAAAVGAAVLWFTAPSGPAKKGSRVEVLPYAGNGSGGVIATGVF